MASESLTGCKGCSGSSLPHEAQDVSRALSKPLSSSLYPGHCMKASVPDSSHRGTEASHGLNTSHFRTVGHRRNTSAWHLSCCKAELGYNMLRHLIELAVGQLFVKSSNRASLSTPWLPRPLPPHCQSAKSMNHFKRPRSGRCTELHPVACVRSHAWYLEPSISPYALF